MFQRLHQNPHHIWCCARSGWWPWCSKKVHQNCYPGRLMFSLLRRWGGIFKSWGGVPKICPRIPTARWGGVPKVGVVLQKIVPESPRLDGVVFQKLGWCSKKLFQNPTLYTTIRVRMHAYTHGYANLCAQSKDSTFAFGSDSK